MKCYASTKRNMEREQEEHTLYYKELPDRFVCSCGKVIRDLSTVKANLHGFLGQPMPSSNEIVMSREFHQSFCNEVLREFRVLIDENHIEEIYQTFLKKNSILLHLFSPKKLYFKKPIIHRYCTDISILNHQNELIFIELEKPSTRIMKKGGHKTSEFSHAIDQVYDWLHEAEKHRSAILDAFDLKTDEICGIRGAVIMGRDKGYPIEGLHKLKNQYNEKVRFYTYDDLYTSLSLLSRTISDT